jgi:hypothetical protein
VVGLAKWRARALTGNNQQMFCAGLAKLDIFKLK